jgi:hypothetical protein
LQKEYEPFFLPEPGFLCFFMLLNSVPPTHFQVKIFLKKIIRLKTIILINKNNMYTPVIIPTHIPATISLSVFINPVFQVIV